MRIAVDKLRDDTGRTERVWPRHEDLGHGEHGDVDPVALHRGFGDEHPPQRPDDPEDDPESLVGTTAGHLLGGRDEYTSNARHPSTIADNARFHVQHYRHVLRTAARGEAKSGRETHEQATSSRGRVAVAAYSMTTTTSPAPTVSPAFTLTSFTLPDFSAAMLFSIFMASRTITA